MKRAAFVSSLLLASLAALAGWVYDGAPVGYVESASVPASGTHDFGATNDVVVGGQACCYEVAPSGDLVLSVAAGVPLYPFQLRVVSTGGLVHGPSLVNDNGWVAGSGTNVLYFFPSAAGPTNWLYWGVAR